MGATNAMYSGPWRKLPNAIFHDWPHNFVGTSIEDLAQELIRIHKIEKGDIIIGSSLGGMVACEIANQIDLGHLVLVGSARHPKEISNLLNLLSPIVDFTPLQFIQFAASSIPNELSLMFAQTEPDFIRRMCKAIFHWRGLTSNVALTRIHGSHDLVIPTPFDSDCTIEGGGHLIAMSKAKECVENIRPKT